MRYLSVALLTLALVSTSVHAQRWTAEQREVWAFQLSCFDSGRSHDLDRQRRCFHPEYMGWLDADPLPTGPPGSGSRRLGTTTDLEVQQLRPLEILVRPGAAVVHYIGMQVHPGSDEVEWFRCTDVLTREGRRWTWIASNCGGRTLGTGPSPGAWEFWWKGGLCPTPW